ncbi:MAG: hypothetical protein WAQ22_02220 [Candidatus Saccharimonas sp.]
MTAKKTTTKKATTPKKTTKASVSTKSKSSASKPVKSRQMRSFKLEKPTEPFMTFRITRQTIYWLVLSIIVLCFGTWLIYVTAQIQSIYDQIDETNSIVNNLSPEALKKIQEHRSTTTE